MRRQFSLCDRGGVLEIVWTKTIQNRERSFEIPLPFIRQSVLCTTSSILCLFGRAGALPSDAPLLAVETQKGPRAPTPQQVRQRLRVAMSRIGLSVEKYGTHSLRRGGATWLVTSGVPLEVVREIGDCKSDCISRYIKPDIVSKFAYVSNAIHIQSSVS